MLGLYFDQIRIKDMCHGIIDAKVGRNERLLETLDIGTNMFG